MAVKVLYIASSPRSGSTILERVLGQLPGVFAAGELRYLWERGLMGAQLCGCGQPVPACAFWQPCLAEWRRLTPDAPDAQAIDILIRRIMRLRYAYQQRLPARLRAPDYPSEEIARFSVWMAQLLQVAARRSGAQVIVDSSKLVSYGSLLRCLPGIEVHIVHLVRDSRAVVFSHQRLRERPEIVGETVYMDQLSWQRVSRLWLTNNLSVGLLRGESVKSVTRVRYDAFVEEPVSVLARILERVGYTEAGWQQVFRQDNRINLGVNHTVAGNPVRFQVGEIALRQDDEWRRHLSPNIRRQVTLVTLPLLLRYRFLP